MTTGFRVTGHGGRKASPRVFFTHALLLLLSLVAAGMAPAPGTVPLTKMAIVPLGSFGAAAAESVAASLRETYKLEVTVLKAEPLPSEAFYKPRGRYRADKLLDFLEGATPPEYGFVLGLTDRDISFTKDAKHYDWGIFGLAYMSRRPCVVSTFRLQRKVSRNGMMVRLLKVARHEVGHTFGLQHCPDKRCAMADAEGSIKGVDSSDGSFCKGCAGALGSSLVKNGPIKAGGGP